VQRRGIELSTALQRCSVTKRKQLLALRVSGNFTISVIQKLVDTSKSIQIPTHHVQNGTVTYRRGITALISPKPPDRLWCPSDFLFIGKREFFHVNKTDEVAIWSVISM